MDAQVKARWVEALRSGRYRQTDSVCYHGDENGYCCLGVLAHLNGMSNKELDGKTFPSLDDDGEELPYGGLSGPVQLELSSLNDGHAERKIRRHTFPEIADWIEENL